MRVPLSFPDEYRSERALCETLRWAALRLGARFYPECSGWDALLVLESGEQMGVQAKLVSNLDVLGQAIEKRGKGLVGPDMRAVLVPRVRARHFEAVAAGLRVTVLEPWTIEDPTRFAAAIERAARWETESRCWVPPYEPDHPAGVPAPRTVSRWRVEAARLCAELREGKTFTAREIEARHVGRMSTWYRWLERVPGTRPARYRPMPRAWLPDRSFPEVARGLGLPEPV